MILMIYNNQMCREVLLPNLYNADHREIISADMYGLQEDITLSMEVKPEGWLLKKAEGYSVYSGGAEHNEVQLKDGDIVTVYTDAKESVRIIVTAAAFSFLITEKFDLSYTSEITIGKNQANAIRYDYRGLISGNHAVLMRRTDGWYIRDISTNGVFSERGRIRDSRKLEFAEHINIFGLHLVFLGDVLAVGTYYGNLYIRREMLQRIEDAPAITDAAASDEKFNRAPRNMPSLYEGQFEIEKPPARKEAEKKSWFMVVGPSLTMSIPMILGSIMMIWAMSQMLTSDSNQVAMMVIMSVGLVTSVGSAIIGAIWASQNLKFTRNEEAENEKKRFNAYSNYLIRATEELESKYSYNAETMHKMYPAATVCAGYGRENPELWSRNQTHADFLQHRLGIGDVPFQMEIKVPEKHFTVDNDSLLEKPAEIKEQFSTLNRVPVSISLKSKQLIGLVGGKGKQGAVSVMQTLIADIAASHCYTDVKFVFLYDEADGTSASDWECMRWFPHVWSEDRQTRYMAANEVERRDILFALSNVMRSRVEGEDLRRQGGVPKPYYLLFVSDPAFLEGELMSRFIYSPKPEYGLTTFLMVESVEELPNTCEDVIEDDKNFQGYYNLLLGQRGRIPVQPDRVSAAMLEQMGRRLSGIRVQETEVTSEIPQSLDFFSMYGVRSLNEFNVEERWRKNRTYNSMKALIGRKSGDADCFLDVHEKYHGPHGLMAGTTGSGKSETLQTYILSLALNFSPEDVAFFIIDFKGGGMANLFSNLPHMAGQISNLSGNQVHRAMISIKSENMRRQQIFTEYGVNNINLYTRLYKEHEAKEPIPHLFIIIDEFAELKKEEPDFMRELISVAQVGRSLGVHLILATQKPSGTVDDNIWSNSRFRICLRVQDQQDSKDMLHKPDAAFLTQTGRGYLQVGSDEIYELFQTGWSGAPYEEDTGVRDEPAVMLTRTGRESLATTRLRRLRKEQRASEKGLDAKSRIQDVTQLSAVVDYLEKRAPELGFGRARQLWMPVLGDHILLAELPKAEETAKKAARSTAAGTASAAKGGLAGTAGAGTTGDSASRHVFSLSTRVGLTDDPERQRQSALVLDFAAGGNVTVCGSVSSGKSTFLQTMLYGLYSKYTPDQLQCYILDFSSHMLAPFAGAPHTGGVVFENQADRLDKFMHFLIAMMDERREVLQGGNYAQYVQAHGQTMPAILLVIDNIGSMREKSDMQYDELLDRYVREGTGYGMYLAASTGGFGLNDMPVRIADNIKTAVSLEQSDRYKYMDVLRRTGIAIMPEQGVKGRGLCDVDGRILEFQTALCFEAEDDYERGKMLESLYEKMSAAWTGARPAPIPEIPANPTLTDLEENADYAAMCAEGDRLPFAYNTATAAVFGAGLRETYCYMISGRAHTGKTNVLKLFMYSAKRMGGQLTVIEPGSTELSAAAQDLGARYVQTPAQVYAFFEELIPEFVRRNQKKQSLVQKGMDEYEIYRGMRDETPIFIFLSDLLAFFKVVYGEALPEFAVQADTSAAAGAETGAEGSANGSAGAEDGANDGTGAETGAEGSGAASSEGSANGGAGAGIGADGSGTAGAGIGEDGSANGGAEAESGTADTGVQVSAPEPEVVGDMSGFMENILEKGSLHRIYFFGCQRSDNTGELEGYRAYNYYAGYKKGVHLGGNLSAQSTFTFQNVSYMDMDKTMRKGLAYAADEEDDTVGIRIAVPLARRETPAEAE